MCIDSKIDEKDLKANLILKIKESMIYPELNLQSKILTLENEIWRDIKDYEGFYQVSTYGRVKRLKRTQLNSNQSSKFLVEYPEIIMKVNPDSKGYPQVTLSYPKRKVARVHRLVADAFLYPPSDELVLENKKVGLDYTLVNHIDQNKMNPRLDNLEWCTVSYNNNYGDSKIGNPKISGSANYSAKLTEKAVAEIVTILKNGEMSQNEIAEKFGVKQITISNIWTGRSWSHFTGIKRTRRSSRKQNDVSERLSEGSKTTCH